LFFNFLTFLVIVSKKKKKKGLKRALIWNLAKKKGRRSDARQKNGDRMFTECGQGDVFVGSGGILTLQAKSKRKKEEKRVRTP